MYSPIMLSPFYTVFSSSLTPMLCCSLFLSSPWGLLGPWLIPAPLFLRLGQMLSRQNDRHYLAERLSSITIGNEMNLDSGHQLGIIYMYACMLMQTCTCKETLIGCTYMHTKLACLLILLSFKYFMCNFSIHTQAPICKNRESERHLY